VSAREALGTDRRSAGAGPPVRRVRVLWNPNAGAKTGPTRSAPTRDDLLALLARHRLGDDLRETASGDEARRLTREAAAEGVEVVVAAGGDGTAHDVADELLGTSTALGILPLGTVMNIPRMLGLPRELEPAAEAIAQGTIRSIDVGLARGEPFYESGSVGMNAAMFREAQGVDDGDWLAPLRTIWVAIRYRPARMSIHLDGDVVRTRALMVAVSNGPYTGAGMTVAPGARLDDGLFDVRVFRRFSKWQLVRHLASIAFGRRRYAPEVTTHRSSRVRIESVHPLPCRADSRDLGTTPIDFEVDASKLRVVVPPPPPGESAAAPESDAID
jgi:diacylglycerol kinase (ATP)